MSGAVRENTTGDMIGASPAMKAIRAELESAARSDARFS
jgi:DNA-binding NtrC family response regulator